MKISKGSLIFNRVIAGIISAANIIFLILTYSIMDDGMIALLMQSTSGWLLVLTLAFAVKPIDENSNN